MAEVAAGLWAAEEVVSTSAQAAIAAYVIAKPTLPLKATLTRIATSTDDSTKLSLSRSGHTVSLINDRAYIFGGTIDHGELAGTDIHVLTLLAAPESPGPLYSILPAAPSSETDAVPAPRTLHAACTLSDVCIVISSGIDADGALVKDPGDFWLYNIEKHSWQSLQSGADQIRPEPRCSATIERDESHIFLVGGTDAAGKTLRDCWAFQVASRVWTRLADVPAICHNFAFVDHKIYAISASDEISVQVHYLDCKACLDVASSQWTTLEWPANAPATGPAYRVGAGLVPLSTGHGRQYLLYLFGTKELDSSKTVGPEPRPLFSDMWAFQLPSKASELKPIVSINDSIQGAKIKDNIRGAIGLETYQNHWAELELLPPPVLDDTQGKLHPGPRAYPACAVLSDGKRVFFWGGTNPKGECEGDGWLIDIAT